MPPLAAIVLLALGLRLWGLHSQSFTMDEIADLQGARGTLDEIIHLRDGFPPLYGLLLHAWLTLFTHDAAVRALSVVLGLLAVVAIWRLGRLAGGPRVGLASALTHAVSPFHIWFSQEARAYALYILLAVVALWLFFRAMATNRIGDWLAYASACVAGLYSHYYFALLPLTTGMILFVEKRAARDLAPGAMAHVVFGLLSLSIVPLLQQDLSYQAGYRLEAPFNLVTMGYTYFTAVAGFAVGPSLRDLHSLPTTSAIRLELPWMFVLGGSMIVLGDCALRTLRSHAIVVRIVLLLTLPVLAGGLLAELLGVGFRVRYLAWIIIPLCVLLGAGGASWRIPAPRRLAMLSLAIVWSIAALNRHTVQRYWNEDVQALGRFLRSVSSASVPVFVMSDYMAIPVEFYLGPGWNVCALPSVPAESVGVSDALRVINTVAARDSEFWFVYTRPFHSDPTGRVPRDLASAGLIRARASFAGVTLYQGRTHAHDASLEPLTCQPPNPMPDPQS